MLIRKGFPMLIIIFLVSSLDHDDLVFIKNIDFTNSKIIFLFLTIFLIYLLSIRIISLSLRTLKKNQIKYKFLFNFSSSLTIFLLFYILFKNYIFLLAPLFGLEILKVVSNFNFSQNLLIIFNLLAFIFIMIVHSSFLNLNIFIYIALITLNFKISFFKF